MKKIMTVPIAICLASILVLGCSASRSYVPPPSTSEQHVLTGGLVKSGYVIADSLVSKSKVPISNNDTILVASFVNINNLQESSTLGRMLAEHVASRLSQRGYKVIDMRLRTESVFMQEGKGEFLLSRDLREVSKNHNASAVVVGTYGEALYGIYISARIINPADSTIISSCDYGLALGRGSSGITTAK
jgi:TolB-like protein